MIDPPLAPVRAGAHPSLRASRPPTSAQRPTDARRTWRTSTRRTSIPAPRLDRPAGVVEQLQGLRSTRSATALALSPMPCRAGQHHSAPSRSTRAAPHRPVPAPSRTVQRLINAFRISLRHRRQRLPSLCATCWGGIGSAGFWTRLSSGLAEMLGIEGSLGESDECEHRGKRGDFVANAGCLGPHRAHDDPPTRSPSGPSRTPSRSDAAGLRRSKRDSRWADHEGRSDGAIDGAISLDPPI